MKEAKYLLEIVRSFIENRDCDKDESIEEEKLYKLAKTHKVSNFMQNWAKTNCQSGKIKAEIQKDYQKQILKDTNENIELENILNKFEEAKIETLVVKGVIMKEVYPQPYMRQMCDIDIMIHSNDFKKASKIMKNLGFREFYDHEKHLVFVKEPFILVEMHRKLIPGSDIAHEYFNDIWPLCKNYKDYKNVYQMTIDDSYIFCIIHLIRHFKYGGIEIRDVLDVYLYNEKYKDAFDRNKLNEKFEEFEAKEFENHIKEIAYKWFGTNKIDELNDIEKFILKGQNIDNLLNYAVGEKQGKENYILKLFFPEFKIMKEKYPVLKKAPILLPFTWLARISKDIFSKESTLKERFNTIKLIQATNQEEVESIHKIYRKLGIKGKEE